MDSKIRINFSVDVEIPPETSDYDLPVVLKKLAIEQMESRGVYMNTITRDSDGKIVNMSFVMA